MPSIAVIGSGFAGIAAADALSSAGEDVAIYEARPFWGGHTHASTDDGFTFDEGPHVSFTKDAAVQDVFARGAGEFHEFSANITNWFRDRYITHPAQCHLYGLDAELVTRCITDLVAAHHDPPDIHTYADWCRAMFGSTFAETFPFAYTRKYWTIEADAMGTDWVGKRMYPPKLEEVVRGALTPDQEGAFHYLSSFRYPTQGGYQAFMRAMVHEELIHLNKEVVRIDPKKRQIEFRDEEKVEYDRLISTMPLPELIKACTPSGVPSEVAQAAEALLCTSLVLVDVAANRADLSPNHWFYVYDEDLSISRGHFPHLLAPSNAPDGCGSIQLEVYHSRHRPLPCEPAALPERVVKELIHMKILHSADDVRWARERQVSYANVVFDHHRNDALAVILPWVEAQGIIVAGRYGEWGYHWTDDATRSGWAAARKIADLRPVSSAPENAS